MVVKHRAQLLLMSSDMSHERLVNVLRDLAKMLDSLNNKGNLETLVIDDLEDEIEEEFTPLKPKCPKCGEEVACGLLVTWPASIPGYAVLADGELNIDILDGAKLGDFINDEDAIYSCPHCNEQLFKASEEDRMEEFLKNIPSNA